MINGKLIALLIVIAIRGNHGGQTRHASTPKPIYTSTPYYTPKPIYTSTPYYTPKPPHEIEKACFLPLNEFCTANDGYENLAERFFQYPFIKPLKNQVPYCPKVDAYLDCEYHQRYRTPDGTCNNLIYKWWGSRWSPYQRLLEPEYSFTRNEYVPRLNTPLNQPLPDPRLVANKLPVVERLSGLNAWFTFFGQLVAHDLARTPTSAYVECECDSLDTECFNIFIKEKYEDEIVQCLDETYPHPNNTCRINPYYQECIPFPRSADVKTVFDCEFEQREQFTKGTHFLDLDIIYGPSNAIENNIRAFSGGKLKLDIIELDYKPSQTSLPILDINKCIAVGLKSTGCVYSADPRVDQFTFVAIMHLLFQRVHNWIAEDLEAENPKWNDEYIYQETRRIVVAIYQNIIYSEYLPLAIGKETMAEFSLDPLESGYNWNYDDYLYPNNYNEFIAAAFRLHHTVHGDIQFLNFKFEPTTITIGSNYLSFADFELHLMAFNSWLYYDQILTLMFSFVGEATYNAQFGLISGLNHLLPLTAVNGDNRRKSLGAANIQRGRDHGIPGYGNYRYMAGSPYPRTWDDLYDVFLPSTIATLQTLYEYPADIDLWVGLIAEKPQQKQLLAKTQSWLIGKNFYALKYGDRFYYENGQDKVNRFTEAQLNQIRLVGFSSLLCMAFGEYTAYSEMPEYGFFMPFSLTKYFTMDKYCFFEAPENYLRFCGDLPMIDPSLWNSANTDNYYDGDYYGEVLTRKDTISHGVDGKSGGGKSKAGKGSHSGKGKSWGGGKDWGHDGWGPAWGLHGGAKGVKVKK